MHSAAVLNLLHLVGHPEGEPIVFRLLQSLVKSLTHVGSIARAHRAGGE